MARTATPEPLGDAIGLLIAVWSALALGGALAATTRRDLALLASFGLAAGLCVADAAARARLRRPAPGSVRRRTSARLGSIARFGALIAAGAIVAPGLAQATLALGSVLQLPTALGTPLLPAPSPARPFGHGSPTGSFPIELVTSLILAPAFEEHLYRGRLMPALVARTGGPVALVVSSAAFALPHLEPWSVLGAAVAGLVLGARWLRTARVGDCAALHAGMNAAMHGFVRIPPLALADARTGWWLGLCAIGLVVLLGPRWRRRKRLRQRRAV